ncbi:NnrS family protein [Candidatus Thioglobus sp.]|uniref:NnrS family protein n=1 Tax=Candidatus Thioglobus sp. TaxID=2026721 RepID=UPI003D096273
MINLNKNTEYQIKPLLRLGFRPFFFASGIVAIVSMVLWLLLYQSIITINVVDASIWHAHEMIYAYASATIVGFLLTASRNWTGVQTIYGKPLLALFIVWTAGRFLIFIEADYLIYQAIIDTAFLLIATASIAHPIIKGKNWSNVSIVMKMLLLTVAHIAFYLGVLGLLENGINIGIYSGFYLIISLLLMMSRRLLPFFIERGLDLQVELKNSKFLDLSSLFLFLAFIIAEVFFQSPISNLLAAILFITHAIRMFNWHHTKIWTKSLLWSIYLAYGLLTLGFGLNAAAYFVVLMPNIDIHSFAFGIALMTLSMMSRISLGHTGRNVFAPPKSLNLMFVLLALAFVFRVVIASIFMQYYSFWMLLSQILWISAFVWFVVIYSPMFFKSRVDGQFG